MRGRSISEIFCSLAIVVVSYRWSNLFSSEVLEVGEEVIGKDLGRKKDIEVEVRESSRSIFMGERF